MKNKLTKQDIIRIEKISKSVRSLSDKLLVVYPDYFDDDLCRACAILSWALVRALKRCGYPAKFVVGLYDNGIYFGDENHCWVKVCNFYVDITATQFGISKNVYITKIGEDKKYIPKKSGLKTVVTHVNKFWPSEQCPRTYRLRLPKEIFS